MGEVGETSATGPPYLDAHPPFLRSGVICIISYLEYIYAANRSDSIRTGLFSFFLSLSRPLWLARPRPATKSRGSYSKDVKWQKEEAEGARNRRVISLNVLSQILELARAIFLSAEYWESRGACWDDEGGQKGEAAASSSGKLRFQGTPRDG